ncbi:unnamed protein product [Anisakis simplex]|uniref:F-BAR domain-containing protein n=1 Tax=Anisakis simplex TaxID=6269 RepID=A0A0M3JYE3_ANISI|nr:unnamed protein product [Anisakis simplex]
MVAIDYAEHFWGEKHHGYHVLYENLKQGEESVQELAQFLKERASFEEETSKFIIKTVLKTSSLCSTSSCGSSGSAAGAGGGFNALTSSWQVTKDMLDSLATIQSTFFQSLQQLLKDVLKYHEELVRSRKRMKEQDVVDAVNLMQTTTTCLQKVLITCVFISRFRVVSKETYAQRYAELERLKKENGTSKEILKAESKLTKSREEYRSYVEKYGRVRDEFEDKMIKAAHAFQEHHHAFLQQMKTFLCSFARVADLNASASSQVYSQYRETIDQLDVNDIMLKFVDIKGTGKDRPEIVIFEELDTAILGTGLAQATTVLGTTNTSADRPELTAFLSQSRSQASSSPQVSSDLLNLFDHPPSNQHVSTTSNSVAATTNAFDSTQSAVGTGAGGGGIWNNNIVNNNNSVSHPSPTASDSSSSLTVPTSVVPATTLTTTPTAVVATCASNASITPTATSFSSSLGRQKLSLWLPGKRRKHASQSSLPSTDMPVTDFSHSQSESSGQRCRLFAFQKNFRCRIIIHAQPQPLLTYTSTSEIEDTRSTTSSSKSDEKGFLTSNNNANGVLNVMDMPLTRAATSVRPVGNSSSQAITSRNMMLDDENDDDIDDEGYTCRRDLVDDGNTRLTAPIAQNEDDDSRWSSCTESSDDDDEDEERIRAAKLRQLNIRPLSESKASVNVSVDELRDAIGHINLSASINRSSTFDRDPWTATTRTTPFSLSLGGASARPLRATLTGDDHLRKRFYDSSNTTALPFSVSLSAGTMARARPRSNTPTLTQTQAQVCSFATPTSVHSTNPLISQQSQPQTASSQFSAALLNNAHQPLSRRESSGSSENTAFFMRSESVNSLGGYCFQQQAQSCQHTESPFFNQPTPSNQACTPSAASTNNSASSTITEHRVPIAMAVNEYIHAWFKGADINQRVVRVFGTVLISFPASAVPVLTDLNSDLEALKFRLTSADNIKAVLPNKQLLSNEVDAYDAPFTFRFERTQLAEWLKTQKTDKPNAHFYNAEVLRYEVRDVVSPPLLLTAYWKLEKENTDLRIDYRLNTDSSIQTALLNIAFSVKIDGLCTVDSIHADPKEEWSPSDSTVSWKLTELSRHGECNGSLKARLAISNGPSNASQTHVQFQTSDASISGASVVVDSDDSYYLSMLRRKVLSGKYFCDPEIRK